MVECSGGQKFTVRGGRAVSLCNLQGMILDLFQLLAVLHTWPSFIGRCWFLDSNLCLLRGHMPLFSVSKYKVSPLLRPPITSFSPMLIQYDLIRTLWHLQRAGFQSHIYKWGRLGLEYFLGRGTFKLPNPHISPYPQDKFRTQPCTHKAFPSSSSR